MIKNMIELRSFEDFCLATKEGNNQLILPDIDKYFSYDFFDEKIKKYKRKTLRQYTPRYIMDKLGRNEDNSDNQYMHYYLQKKYKNELSVLSFNFHTGDSEKVSELLTRLDSSKINMIPIKFSSHFNPHISVLIINPMIKSIEYYNTICGIGSIKEEVYDELEKLLPDYTIYKKAPLYFQKTNGYDMLCETWICFITECRLLNQGLSHLEFINNMENILNLYPSLLEIIRNDELEKTKYRGNYVFNVFNKYFWYSEVIASYALYFEHEILDLYLENK